jgi:hypothetical protein
MLRRRRQPGRQAQRALLRLPRALARRCRELPRNARQHRRQARRTYNLNLANWIPDLFMRRADEDGMWSLFDPKDVPTLTDLYGEAFEKAYVRGRSRKLYKRQVKARDLYARMMRSLAETGNGWMTFKDACNSSATRPEARQHRASLQSLHRDHRSHLARSRPPSATSAPSTSAAH